MAADSSVNHWVVVLTNFGGEDGQVLGPFSHAVAGEIAQEFNGRDAVPNDFTADARPLRRVADVAATSVVDMLVDEITYEADRD